MLNSYIARLVLIYGCALGLIFIVAYTYYDDWLDQHVTDLETVVVVEEYSGVNPITVIPEGDQQLFRENIEGLTDQVVLIGATLIVLGFIATTVIAWKIHNKLESINKTADHIIIHQDLGRRIPHSGGNNEFDHLSINLNRMLGTIEGKVEDIKQLSNNIAHDLRTPLTSLHNRLEELESDNPQITDLTNQVNQILETFNALLRISHLESGNVYISVQNSELETIVGDVIALFAPLAEEKGQKISMELKAQSVKADINLLFQALANLLENAIKYAPDNANILISSIEVSRQVLIKVQDDGPGIPNDKLEDVKERFVRLDATRSSPGSGLGLSMVRAIAEVHQGTLTLNNLRNGFVATIELPVGEETE